MATDRTIAVTVAVRNVQDAINALKRLGDGGEEALEGIIAKAGAASAGLERLGDAAGRGAGGMGRLGPLVQQAGYQIGDFAVQVAAGQSALIAFAQQGSQLAGLFGPTGAVVGAILGVAAALTGSLLPAFLDTGDGADELGRKVDGAAEAVSRLSRAQRLAREESDRAAAEARAPGNTIAGFFGLAVDPEAEFDAAAGRRGSTDRTSPGLRADQLRAAQQIRRQSAADQLTAYEQDVEKQLDEQLQRQLQGERRIADEKKRSAEQAAAAREREAEAAAREGQQRQQTIRLLEFEAEAAKRVADANEISVEARQRVEREIEAERANLQASFAFKGQELELIERFNTAKAEQAQRIADTDAARKAENERIADYNRLFAEAEREADQAQRGVEQDAQAEAERLAQRQAEILAQPYKDLAGRISGIVSQGIYDGLTDASNFDFGDVAESFAQAIGTAVSGTIGNALTQPLNQAVLRFSDQLAASIQNGGGISGVFKNPDGSANLTNIGLAGGAAGFAVGSIYSSAAGLKPGNQAALGGALGGAAGAIAGQILIPIPGVGAIVGGAVGSGLGSVAGGLFGGENNLGNDRSTQTFNSARGIIYSDRSFSDGNRNITSGIADEVQSLIDLFGDLGGNVANFNLRLAAGNKSGITVNGKKYATAEEALAASIELLIGSTSNLSASQQTALANTKGKTAQEVATDLAFAETFDQLVFNGREVDRVLQDLSRTFDQARREASDLGLSVDELTAAQQRQTDQVLFAFNQQIRGFYEGLASLAGDNSLRTQLHALETQLRELGKTAAELGVSPDVVNAAGDRARDRLIFQNEQNVRSAYSQLAGIAGDDSLATQLFGLETQMRAFIEATRDLGIPLEQITAAFGEAKDRLIEDYNDLIDSTERRIVDQQRGIEDQVRGVDAFFAGLIDPLKSVLANDNRLSPTAQIAQERERFRSLADLAQGGDVEALRQLSGSASTLQGLAAKYLGSGGQGAEIAREIEQVLGSTVGQLEEQRAETLASLPQVQRETTALVVQTLVEQIGLLIEEQEKTRRELRNLRAA